MLKRLADRKVTNHQYIRERRKELGLSQKQVAERVGLSIAQFSYIETGRRNARSEYVPDLAVALQTGVDKLFISPN